MSKREGGSAHGSGNMDGTSSHSESESSESNEMEKAQLMSDDFALGRVPSAMRYGWLSMAMEQIAQGGCIAVVVIGAKLGHEMKAWEAFTAVILGNSILAVTTSELIAWRACGNLIKSLGDEVICIAVGIIGCQEGMTTSMLAARLAFHH